MSGAFAEVSRNIDGTFAMASKVAVAGITISRVVTAVGARTTIIKIDIMGMVDTADTEGMVAGART